MVITEGFGFVDLTETFDGDGFSYFFYEIDEVGSLSHIVGTRAAADAVVDLERWNINSQELYQLTYFQALDYYTSDDEIDFTGIGPYRSSDHDPLLLSMRMGGTLYFVYALRLFVFVLSLSAVWLSVVLSARRTRHEPDTCWH